MGARSTSTPTGSKTDEREADETRSVVNISTFPEGENKREPTEARGRNTSTGSVVQGVLEAFVAVTKQVVQALALQVVGTENEKVPTHGHDPRLIPAGGLRSGRSRLCSRG